MMHPTADFCLFLASHFMVFKKNGRFFFVKNFNMLNISMKLFQISEYSFQHTKTVCHK